MTKAEKTHKSKVAALGCALCYRIHDSHAFFIDKVVKLASPQRWWNTDAGSKQTTSLKGHHA